MAIRPQTLLVLAGAALLSACEGSTGGEPVRSVATKPVAPRVAVRSPVRQAAPPLTPPPPRVQVLPGLEGVIGSSTAELTRQFGTPRLDVWEGDARKLQFTGAACVLDIYLYPKAPGGEPQATYVESRRQSDGRDVNRAACVAALRHR
jgi:hypothetical protein